MKDNKPVYVTFGEKKIEEEFESLKEGKFQDKQLYCFIERAINDIKNNPVSGIKIPKQLWPKVYVIKYNITNLWKYDLPNGWRLIYTLKEDEVMILSAILEWFDHKNYEKRFNH
ncbi:MAG: type II toxin-antitoxin system YoeB family toxin [Nanoarchaeota archaeon]